MSNTKDGGPAFPSAYARSENQGMTLRDYLAGQALAGISAHIKGATQREGETVSQAHARWAYSVADAMLKARAA